MYGNGVVQQVPAPRLKKLRIPKFKGRDEDVTVTAWLKSLQNEVRHQASSMGITWSAHELYDAATALFAGEALEWFSMVDGTLPPDEETIDNLATLMREQYMIARTEPETIAQLNNRVQGRGETLSDFAQNLRRIVAGRGIGEKWLVNAFLNGMSNQQCAMHVRVALGRGDATLREAIQAAVQHTGEFGEGTRVNLLEAESAYDARQGHGGAAASGGQDEMKPVIAASKRESVVTGRGTLGLAPNPEPPRYDAAGRLVSSRGTKRESEWWRNVPPGFKIVPETAGTTGQSSARSEPRKDDGRNKRPSSAGGRHGGKAMKAEAPVVASAYATTAVSPTPLPSREERMRNHERFWSGRARTPYASRPKLVCFYCQQEGHMVRDCPHKKSDYATVPDQATGAAASGQDRGQSPGQGNGQQA